MGMVKGESDARCASDLREVTHKATVSSPQSFVNFVDLR